MSKYVAMLSGTTGMPAMMVVHQWHRLDVERACAVAVGRDCKLERAPERERAGIASGGV